MDKPQGPPLTPYFWQRGYYIEHGVSTSVDLNKISLEDFGRLLDYMEKHINEL